MRTSTTVLAHCTVDESQRWEPAPVGQPLPRRQPRRHRLDQTSRGSTQIGARVWVEYLDADLDDCDGGHWYVRGDNLVGYNALGIIP